MFASLTLTTTWERFTSWDEDSEFNFGQHEFAIFMEDPGRNIYQLCSVW